LEIIDQFCWEEHKKVITHDKHKIQGLKNLAYWNFSTAIPPTPVHHHTDIVEFHCLIKGKRVSLVDGKDYTITGNELFMTFPGEEHSNGSYHQSPCSFYGFQIDLRNRKNLLGLNEEYSAALYEIIRSSEYRHLRFEPSDRLLLQQAFENISDGDPQVLRLGVQYLSCFLFKIPEFIPVTSRNTSTIDSNIKRVMDLIEREYRDVLHLHELAVISGYSLSRFKSKFKEEVGMTPANYIVFKKLEYAETLLKTTDKPVTQIALDAGFSSSNYFSTVMKKLTNYTPGEYRSHFRKSRDENQPSE